MASNPFWDKTRQEWACKYRPDPKGPWVRVKLCDHPTPVSKAQQPRKPPQTAIDRHREFAEIEYRVKHGFQAAPVRAKDLEEYLNAYADSHAVSKRQSSNELLRRFIRNFLEFAEAKGIKSVQAVSRAHCRDYIEWRLKSIKPSSLKTERGILMGAWTRAVEDELIPSNPWLNAKSPARIVESDPVFWSKAEIASIARHCLRPWQGDLVMLLANTGMRIGTALAMEWKWVDWAAGTIKIPSGVDRIKTGYTLNFNEDARDILQRRHATLKDSPVVFPHHDGEGTQSYDTARLAIDRAIRDAGVKAGTPHDLRHSFGRALALEGVPASVIQQQLGHTTLAMTMRYMTTGIEHSARFIQNFRISPDADLPDVPEPSAGGPGSGVEELADHVNGIEPGPLDD